MRLKSSRKNRQKNLHGMLKKNSHKNPNAQKTAKRTARIIKIKRTPRKTKLLNHRIIKNRLKIKRLKRKINLKTVKTIIPATTR